MIHWVLSHFISLKQKMYLFACRVGKIAHGKRRFTKVRSSNIISSAIMLTLIFLTGPHAE